ALADSASVPFAIARSWWCAPSFVTSVAAAITESLSELAASSTAIVLTAHSPPRRVFEAEPGYVEELRETARAVAATAGIEHWSFAYQSAGHTAEDWLLPGLPARVPCLGAQVA